MGRAPDPAAALDRLARDQAIGSSAWPGRLLAPAAAKRRPAIAALEC